MKDRIAKVRKNAGLSQAEMADKLGLSRNFISLVENGNRIPSDRTIADVCRIFGVNDEWLRTGEGEMLKTVKRSDAIADFIGDIMRGEGDDFRCRLIAVLARLDVSEWELLEKMALKLAAEAKKEDQAEA